jgi:hypothetical protein
LFCSKGTPLEECDNRTEAGLKDIGFKCNKCGFKIGMNNK